MYSHLTYDVMPDEEVVVRQPDILIVEGLTVLQSPSPDDAHSVYVSDYFDFSIYVHAEVANIRDWYLERFLTLRETAFRDPRSYFQRYAQLSDDEAMATAGTIWSTINEKNLFENILPTRERADLVLTKEADHLVSQVRLRRR